MITDVNRTHVRLSLKSVSEWRKKPWREGILQPVIKTPQPLIIEAHTKNGVVDIGFEGVCSSPMTADDLFLLIAKLNLIYEELEPGPKAEFLMHRWVSFLEERAKDGFSESV